jgi:two-component system sensor histidine kinase KdpD
VESREAPTPAPASGERILIHVTADPSTAMLIRRGRRVADYLHATCYAVHVAAPGQEAEGDGAAVERHLNFARNLHIDTRTLRGTEVARTLVDFAQLHGITQIFVSRPPQRRFALSLITRIVRLARDMQITIVADRSARTERTAD